MAEFLCNIQGFPSRWAASAKLLKKLQFPSCQWVSLPFSNLSFALGRSIRGQLLKKLQFPCFSHCSKASLLWSQFLSSIAKVSCGIGACHYIQTDGIWLIFSAIFKVFLCFGRLLPCPSFQWVSLKFSRFSFALGGFCQKNWKSCTFLVTFGFWIVTNKSRWHMVYFPCKFQFFPLLWTASAKLLKKSQFPSFQWVSLPFSCSYSALGRSIWDNCWKSCNFDAFPIAGNLHFYDFIALRGPKPVSFVHCQGFLRNLSMSLHTNRWHMAEFLCNFQGFPLRWAASAKMLKKLQFPCFSHCRKNSFLWFQCAKGTKPSFFRPLPRFPAEFEHVTTVSLHTNRWHMAYFLCNVQGFPLLWAASAKMLKKLQFPCFSHCSKASLLWFHCAKGTKPSFFHPLPRFPAEIEHVTTYKQMAYGLFSLQFSRFSFALGGFCQIVEKVAVSILSMGFVAVF